MRRNFAEFTGIDRCEPINENTHPEFLYLLQKALLLALKERGMLRPIPYQQAEEQLRKQYPQRTVAPYKGEII